MYQKMQACCCHLAPLTTDANFWMHLVCVADHWTHLPSDHPLRQQGHVIHMQRVPEDPDLGDEEQGDSDDPAGEDARQTEQARVQHWPPKPVQLPSTTERPALRNTKSIIEAARAGDLDLMSGKDPKVRPDEGGHHSRSKLHS